MDSYLNVASTAIEEMIYSLFRIKFFPWLKRLLATLHHEWYEVFHASQTEKCDVESGDY